ncbi:hypothetical protein C8F04DRAFT_1265339 [Mycena alexandri]|uniref:Uncharacterized protein n=1 Tax=Mycena alexandri TaxID=1745969 RepID=A0AAD6SLU0_9AGAR|nr:hypothetical protein C8F04DRAFT_1265339 [Mycena alexandri]
MSLVTFNCLAVLENPRVPDDTKRKSFVVDAQVYLNGSIAGLVGCLRWYNANDFVFPDEPAKYSLWIQAANMTKAVQHHSDSLETKNYHFAGDILDLAYLGPPDAFSPFNRAIAHVCGTVLAVNEKDSTFDVKAEQYITALGTPGVIHFRFNIPNIPRYNKKKPLPAVGSRALATGRIIDVERLLDADKEPVAVKHFVLEMDSIIRRKAAAQK